MRSGGGSRVQGHALNSNWITYAFGGGPGDWIGRYVAGESYDSTPLWEHVVEGTALVYGATLRDRAYATVARIWPNSLALLELGRIAVVLESSLGRVLAFPVEAGDGVRIRYILDMVDAQKPEFLSRLKAFVRPQQSSQPQGPHAGQRRSLVPRAGPNWPRVHDRPTVERSTAYPGEVRARLALAAVSRDSLGALRREDRVLSKVTPQGIIGSWPNLSPDHRTSRISFA